MIFQFLQEIEINRFLIYIHPLQNIARHPHQMREIQISLNFQKQHSHCVCPLPIHKNQNNNYMISMMLNIMKCSINHLKSLQISKDNNSN